MATKLGNVLADFTTQLTTELAIGGTVATLASATDKDSVALPNGVYFLTLDRENSQKEHIVCTLNGTALTAISSVSRQGVQASSAVRLHRVGASVTLTDFETLLLLNNMAKGLEGFDSTSPLFYDGNPASITGNQIPNATWVLGVVSGGTVYFDQQVVSAQTSGEALAVNDPIYFKESDHRWYKILATTITTFDLLKKGICKTTAGASGITIQVAISGPVSDFSSLTAGSKYYVSNTGTFSTTPGTYSVFMGWALSTTQILLSPYDKTLPTQKEKDAMVGTLGIPDATNKFLTLYNTTTASIDQSQTTQDGSVAVGEVNATTKHNLITQSYIPTAQTLSMIRLWKAADTGTFTGSVKLALQADSGAGSPSGSDLISITLTNAQWLAIPNASEAFFKFATDYTLTIGTSYFIVVTPSTSDNSNHINLGTNSAGGYANGVAKYFNSTDGWVLISGMDLYFRTVEGIRNQIVKTNSSGEIPTYLTTPKIKTTFPYADQKSLTAATSTVVITHNLGKIPSFVEALGWAGLHAASPVHINSGGYATIAADGTITYHASGDCSSGNTASGDSYDTSAAFLDIQDSGNGNQRFTISKITENSIEITITKVNTPSTAATIYYQLKISI